MTARGPTHLVELDGVSRSFGETRAVRDLSLTLEQGEFFSLLGPSGCGKTTTLRMIAGFERSDTGSIRIQGKDVLDLPPHRRPVNTVFQSYALFSHLNVFDNVAFGLRERRRPRDEIERSVRDMLDLVRLPAFGPRRTRQLSGGQQQRVALARALVNEPALLLLDEPLGALDLKLRREMQHELKGLQRRLGITFLYVTHDQEEALTMSDRVGIMADGRLSQVGRPEDIYDRPATRYVAGFVGDANMLEGALVERHGGRIVVALGGGQVASAARGTGLGDASRGCLVVRPERMDIEPSEEGAAAAEGRCAVDGVIEDVVFVGAQRRFVVSTTAGPRVTVSCQNRADPALLLSPGDRVRVSWDESEAWVIGEPAAESGVEVEPASDERSPTYQVR